MRDGRKWFPQCERALPAVPTAEIIVQIGALLPEISAPHGSLRLETQIIHVFEGRLGQQMRVAGPSSAQLRLREKDEDSDAFVLVSIRSVWPAKLHQTFFLRRIENV